MKKVNFHSTGNFRLRDIHKHRKLVETIFHREKVNLVSLAYIFCTDNELRALNKSFLQHDYFTDILTFDLSDSKDHIFGEVYISLDRVKDNAKTFGSSFPNELMRVLIHGALHLCGYRDKTKREISLMRSKEDEYLRLL